MATFAYLRCSTSDQSLDQQLGQIRAAGYQVDDDRVYSEFAVGRGVPALQRPQFSKLNERLADGAVLVVANIDRLGRDVLDCLTTIDSLVARGISIAVLNIGGVIDNSPASRLMLTLLSAISEFEKSLISQRTKAKLAQLKADGVKLGRPVKCNDVALRAKAVELFGNGLSWRRVAKDLGIALSTLQRAMKQTTSNRSGIAATPP